MKKLIITVLVFAALIFSTTAQVSHDYFVGDREPVVTVRLTADQVPANVREAVKVQFDKNNPLTWSKFPYALKEYGWVYDIGAQDVVLDRYEVTMKTDKNTDLWAIYTNKGELVETREMSTNIAIPKDVMDQFNNSQYKDWKIVGNKEIIKFYHDHDLDVKKIEQHFRITVEKNGQKRSISFNWKGNQ